ASPCAITPKDMELVPDPLADNWRHFSGRLPNDLARCGNVRKLRKIQGASGKVVLTVSRFMARVRMRRLQDAYVIVCAFSAGVTASASPNMHSRRLNVPKAKRSLALLDELLQEKSGILSQAQALTTM